MLDKSSESPDECGCAPSEAERRTLWPKLVSRRSALGIGVVGLAVAGAAISPVIPRAFAAGYPSWDDVQRAKQNEAAKASEVSRIDGLIQSLTGEVARTQAVAEQMSGEFYKAQQAFFEASNRADQMQAQADEQAKAALDAANKAGRVAAQLYRDGGDDTSLQLFFAGSAAGADDLLSRLGTMDKLLQRNETVYSDAVRARDEAQSLSDQAQVARTERDRLQREAEAAMIASQQAADAAAAALAEQQAHIAELQAQLAALRDDTAKTVADYQEGERIRQEQERLAELARQAQRQRDQEEADRRWSEQQNNSGGGGGGGNSGGGGGGGGGNGSGWVRPSGGSETSGYGPRTVQCGNSYCSSGFHYGVDLAPGCWANIYAASAGRVVYAGYNGGYGNYIKIDHGGGIGTGYAHIVGGGIYVSVGQWVGAGQHIAAVGNTGNSFGCHLHFETYVNGSAVNPVYFMGDRGISV